MAMHPSALSHRVCPYSICFLDLYFVCHGGGLTTKRRQSLWTRVGYISQKVCVSGPMFIGLFFLLVLPPLKIFYLSLSLYIYYTSHTKYQLVFDIGPDREIKCDEASYCRSVNGKDAGRPRLTQQQNDK